MSSIKPKAYPFYRFYIFFIIVNLLPPISQIPYKPEATQDVIVALLKVSIEPWAHFGVVFHIITLLLIALIIRYKERLGKTLMLYMGIDLIVIALIQSMGATQSYGFVIHTGSLITSLSLGVGWLFAAFKTTLGSSFTKVPKHLWLLAPLALLAFWAPYDHTIYPDFNPLYLVTSVDYGLSFCFTMSVFNYALILFAPKVPSLMYRIMMFNGILYGIFNMSHFFHPQYWWMGVLHLPLLLISLFGMVRIRLVESKQNV